jgi:hypothetical protein
MAIALESYTSDYNGYFPCWPGWGGPSGQAGPYGVQAYCASTSYDIGLVKDRRTGVVIRTGAYTGGVGAYNFNFFAPGACWRTIYCGDTDLSPIPTANALGNYWAGLNPDGQLNMAPSGLGYLVGGGYINDARVFYCPTVGGSMPKDNGYYVNDWDIGGFGYPACCWAVTSLLGLQTAGGYDAHALGYGNWSKVPMPSAANNYGFDNNIFDGLVVQCDYNYRNTPLSLTQGTNRSGGSSAAGWNSYPVSPALLGYTKPEVLIDVGGPPFKTSRTLNGRAIVTDSFSRNAVGYPWGGPPNMPLSDPGYGVYGHKDGYNVLYGDWSARWYGDPKQYFIWYPDPDPSGYLMTGGNSDSICRNLITRWQFVVGTDVSNLTNSGTDDFPANPAGQDAWHIFDVSNGIDVDVTQ